MAMSVQVVEVLRWTSCIAGSADKEAMATTAARALLKELDERTSISRKFSGGPYISSKLCWRASGMACMVMGLLKRFNV